MVCSNCGTENRPGRKFCSNCGQALAVACWNCGASNDPADRFCGECGSALAGPASAAASSAGQPASAPILPAPPTAERRLVSVLFADLVGFTTLSESRDAEEVRDLLSRYFETCSRLIARYGGTVEKFIGDAVMAVWGTPTAQEDDAERAVRAGLDLAEAVSALGVELGAPELQARVGVLTGEAAVTIGAQGQGMVAGDLVNTASRVQSAAEPGTVLVGEVTRRATEAAVIYEDAGTHELKGKAEPVPLWQAVRIIGGVRGAMKASGLEAPFVGRDREMRLVKELFHASADEGKAHLLSATGIAGIGKSRLSWEFFKYIDGLADAIWWHRGRCLAYGEGVTYWALAEMVRMRARIDEGEDRASAMPKLRTAVQRHVPDPEERKWIEPRLAHLLGLEERQAVERQDLFAAWRLFFERLCDESPTIMVFEDMQWADAALIDFIEYLLEWSRSHPLFVMTLARPELADRYPNWGAGKRNFTSLFLEPLPAEAMQQLLTGLMPGVTEDLRTRIQERAEGIPLYAVETVRMLIDRGLLIQEGTTYRPSGPIESLEVPETLHALIAARLDGLTRAERQVVQDASVLGKTFTKRGLSALSGKTEVELEPILSSLIRKEILSFQTDPRSTERGQFGFLQDLLKRVAYETLSKKERRARHLSVADYLESEAADEEEFAEIVASHYMEAFGAAPDTEDASAIKEKARHALVRAGQHARSLAATIEAQRYFEQALDLADAPSDRAQLAEQAATMASRGARLDEAGTLYDQAAGLYASDGNSHAAARASAALGWVLWRRGDLDQAIERMESAFDVLSGDEPDQDIATLAAQLARLYFFGGEQEKALVRIDEALAMAESMQLPEVLAEALNTKSLILNTQGRIEEALALLTHALRISLENDAPSAALRAYNNLDFYNSQRDRYGDVLEIDLQGLALARKIGDQFWEWSFLGNVAAAMWWIGSWDESLARLKEIPDPDEVPEAGVALDRMAAGHVFLDVYRGDLEEAERWSSKLEPWQRSKDIQDRAGYFGVLAVLREGQERYEESGKAAEEALNAVQLPHLIARQAVVQAIQAALALGDHDKAEALLGQLERATPVETGPYVRAQLERLRARFRWATGKADGVESGFKTAMGAFREFGLPFYRAITQLEYGEWLGQVGRADDSAEPLREARETFEELRARPWLERVSRAEQGLLERTAVS
jgi:predicted ATPase/class 3 adenylate cyclase